MSVSLARVCNPAPTQVLTFKEINWQSLRIEADAMESEEQDLGSTPLRLITNQGRIRIALKRRVWLPPPPNILKDQMDENLGFLGKNCDQPCEAQTYRLALQHV